LRFISRVRKSTRSRKEPEKYKNFEMTAIGKGKQREGQGVKKRGGKK
jgi:hypothetical protein